MVLLRAGRLQWHPSLCGRGQSSGSGGSACIQAAFDATVGKQAVMAPRPKVFARRQKRSRTTFASWPWLTTCQQPHAAADIGAACRLLLLVPGLPLKERAGDSADLGMWVSNIAQKAEYMGPCHGRVPAILRQSQLWVFGKKRWPCLLSIGNAKDGACGPTHRTSVSSRQTCAACQTPSSHIRAIGTVVAFALACVQRVDPPSSGSGSRQQQVLTDSSDSSRQAQAELPQAAEACLSCQGCQRQVVRADSLAPAPDIRTHFLAWSCRKKACCSRVQGSRDD